MLLERRSRSKTAVIKVESSVYDQVSLGYAGPRSSPSEARFANCGAAGDGRALIADRLLRLALCHTQHAQDGQQEKGRCHHKDQVIVAAAPFDDVAVDRWSGHGCQLGGDVVQPGVGSQVGVGGGGVHHHWKRIYVVQRPAIPPLCSQQ